MVEARGLEVLLVGVMLLLAACAALIRHHPRPENLGASGLHLIFSRYLESFSGIVEQDISTRTLRWRCRACW